jgi:hypothetical protein
VSERIPRNEAIEIVGREHFADAWVGEMTKSEWDIVQAHKSRFAAGTEPPVEIADQLYLAEERAARSDRQHREVILWLENHGLDCVRGLRDGLDRKTFEKAFAKAFGSSSLPRREPEALKTKFRIPSDGPLLQTALQALKDGKATGPYQAAKLVHAKAEGNSAEANLRRLRRLITDELKARGE